MSGPPKYHFTCRRKIRYEKRNDARAVVKEMRALGKIKPGRVLTSYYCAFCRGYHVGHQSVEQQARYLTGAA